MVVSDNFNFPEVEWSESGCWTNNGGEEEENFLESIEDRYQSDGDRVDVWIRRKRGRMF